MIAKAPLCIQGAARFLKTTAEEYKAELGIEFNPQDEAAKELLIRYLTIGAQEFVQDLKACTAQQPKWNMLTGFLIHYSHHYGEPKHL